MNYSTNDMKIKDKEGNVLAVVVPKTERGKMGGVKFLTPTEYPLQVGLIGQDSDRFVRPHIHRDLKYDVRTTQEFIYVESGLAEATVYDKDFDVVKRIKLSAGDIMLTVSGGHAFKIHAGSRLVEVKQGPYPGNGEAKIYK